MLICKCERVEPCGQDERSCGCLFIFSLLDELLKEIVTLEGKVLHEFNNKNKHLLIHSHTPKASEISF
jgi:hypothetical protein